jgi:hypothetical protein
MDNQSAVYTSLMVTDKIKQLEATKAKLEKLEGEIAASLKRELASLPQKFGFASVGDFVDAVLSASGGRGRSKAGKAGGKARRRRAVITASTHAEVKKLVEAGKTGAEIAKTVGISVPSVHNIKKSLGLVKARK